MSRFEPIAVVGEACLLPGASSPGELWRAVLDRRDLLSRATAATWQVADMRRLMRTDAEAAPAERIPTDRGGYVTGFEALLRPADYGLDAALVRRLDPLFQWLLHVGHEAVAGARISPAELARGGAIIGNLSYPTYALNEYAWSVWAESAGLHRGARPDALNRFMSGAPVELISRSLGLGRGGFMVDAACASSLYALRHACDWLQSGRADVMLAGGVARVHGLTIHAGFTTLQALSPTGQSRPLHAHADGLVPSEGAAVVVLKRLTDALRDGNPILGVIRAVGLANDGRGSGLLVPSADGQVRAMEAAYRSSGLSPRDVDLIECHATGTAIGDATELASCVRVFHAAKSIALGSLKSNLGHLLPVAGVAALIKVLQAMRHGIHGPLRALDEPTAALQGTPFAPVLAAREWPVRDVRRAAVNAFGFGGNNAHLIVEQLPTPVTVSFARPEPAAAGRAAIVAVALRVGSLEDAVAYAKLAWSNPTPAVVPSLGDISLPLEKSAFTPSDLEHALPQQLLALELAHRALRQLPRPPGDDVSVFIGMGCDPDACRFGMLLRLDEFLRDHGVTAPLAPDAVREVRRQVNNDMVAAMTLGLMPNVVANRLNRQFGANSASCAVSAEEDSGLCALERALAALNAGECRAALVGAVELGADPVHAAARRETNRAGRSADGGCLLILKRETDARRDGDRIVALIEETLANGAVEWVSHAGRIEQAAGIAHAARGLMQVAAAAVALEHTLLDADQLVVRGVHDVFMLSRSAASTAASVTAAPAAGKMIRFAAHRPPVAEFLRDLLHPVEEMPIAPRLAALTPGALTLAPTPPREEESADALDPDVAVGNADALGSERVPPSGSNGDAGDEAGLDIARVHEVFLTEMAAAHEAFLRQSLHRPPVSSDDGGESRPWSAGVPPAWIGDQKSEVGGSPRPASSGPAASQQVDASQQEDVAALAEPLEPTAPADGALPGPKFSREDLIQLASGRISSLFGPDFAEQDAFVRQVRMPMPPMLLADRVTGIDATPGVLGPGTIWTETDVTPDAWYLDGDRMPLGITIEAGQADLLLVSWMGIDRFNRSDRIYRLLGCEATIKGPLPKIGDTLKFEIAIDGHAELGPIRMMFFHSDLYVNGEARLSVRNGQAGFFTDEELADSEGVLWDAATAPAPDLRGTHAGPRVASSARTFGHDQVRAFAEGRPADCFGTAWRRTRGHTRTPRIGQGRVQLFDEVTHFDPCGGPWGRGYLRTTMAVTPDLWFFGGHFKNDPCMPGTLMLEGAVQSMAFYLAALGCTINADGWRFEPPAGQTVMMRCRGQCVPTSRELAYELFIEEFNDGPIPRLRASVMGSVDGLKAFFAEGLTLELVPDWPLEAMLRRGDVQVSGKAPVWTLDGFPFDHRSLLACALGRPSEAFGPGFRHLDHAIRIPRLPRPPYHFMSRITACTGRMGRPERGAVAEADFDLHADDWFFAPNGSGTMPACVFMEALLQPCGWLSSFLRDSTQQKEDIFFRNLDGTLTWHREIQPAETTLHVRTELTNWSELGAMIIVSFKVDASLAGAPVATMETSFGFFPGDAFASQAGIAPTAAETDVMQAAANVAVAVDNARLPAGAPLAGAPLLMLDRITGWWPTGGSAQLGVVRAEKAVDAGEWFFKAHFMQDPVQPGSLGIEALLQLLQAAVRLRGLGRELTSPVFEPLALAEPLTWKYRGQVVPENGVITTLVELVEIVSEAEGGVLVRARGSLWVDGKKIYETPRLAMRVRAGTGPVSAASALACGNSRVTEWSLARQPWLHDHRPSFTRSIVPLTSLIDEVASAVESASGHAVVEIGPFFPARWVVCPEDGSTKLRVEAQRAAEGAWGAELGLWREASVPALSRFDRLAETRLVVASGYPVAPAPLAPLTSAPLCPDPYRTHETTHGPAFQLLRELRRSPEGASCIIDADAGTVPTSTLHPALLDSCTHAVPFSRLREWYPDVPAECNGLPRGIRGLKRYGPTPRGLVRCELRPRGMDATTGLPLAYVQFIADDAVWCELELEFALLDATPFHGATYAERESFIRRAVYHPTVRFSRDESGTAVLGVAELAGYQWMPGQLEMMFRLPPAASMPELAEAIAARELLAHTAAVHPARVQVADGQATTAALPIQPLPLAITHEDDTVRVSAGPLRLAPPAGETFFAGPFLDDLLQAVTRRFVRHFLLADPEAAAPIRGQPVILCSNHQTALESLLFTDLFMRWSGLPLTTVTRVEHEHSWVGQVTDLLWRHPRRTVDVHPQMLFDRDRPDSFFDLIHRFKAAVAVRPHVLHLHVEGEQARRAGQPVARMTSAIIDLALETGLPIVPVKFSGGLPRSAVDEVVSFPHAYGRQDYTVGAPLRAEELRRVPRPKAAEQVVAAINALPPAAGDEQPLAAGPEFGPAVAACRGRHALSEVQAAVLTALRELAGPSAITEAILAWPSRGSLPVPPAEQAWHAEFAQWLWRTDAAWQRELEAWKLTAKG